MVLDLTDENFIPIINKVFGNTMKLDHIMNENINHYVVIEINFEWHEIPIF